MRAVVLTGPALLALHLTLILGVVDPLAAKRRLDVAGAEKIEQRTVGMQRHILEARYAGALMELSTSERSTAALVRLVAAGIQTSSALAVVKARVTLAIVPRP